MVFFIFSSCLLNVTFYYKLYSLNNIIIKILYHSRLQDVKDEFDDFQDGSRELEAELEAQLEQYEKRVKELVSVRSSLEDENETLKVRIVILVRYFNISEYCILYL